MRLFVDVLRTSTSCTIHLGPKNWNAATHQAVVKFDVLAERNPLQKDHHLVLAFNRTQSWDAPPIFNSYHIPYLPVGTSQLSSFKAYEYTALK